MGKSGILAFGDARRNCDAAHACSWAGGGSFLSGTGPCWAAFNSEFAIPDWIIFGRSGSKLQIQLRFRESATIAFISSTTVTVLTVLFAVLHFGAYSFILPWPISAALRAAMLWKAAPCRIRSGPRIRDCGDGKCQRVVIDDGNLHRILCSGRLHDPWPAGVEGRRRRVLLGVCSLRQTLQLLAFTVGGVLLPSLVTLNAEPDRQMQAFLRACRALLIVSVPVCLLQAAMAPAMIRLFLPDKWQPAAPLVQILSIGWSVGCSAGPSTTR